MGNRAQRGVQGEWGVQRKRGRWGGRIAFWVTAAVSLTTCRTLGPVFQEPRLSLRSVDLTGVSFSAVDLLCQVNVENPNLIDIAFPEIDWDLFINGTAFVKGVIKNDRAIKSGGATVVDIPLTVAYQEMFSALGSLAGSKEADYKIALAAKFNLPVLGAKVFRIEREGKLPVLRVPSVRFKGIAVKNTSLTRLDFEISWEVENNNGFALDMKELSYSLAVNGSPWASGAVPDAPSLPPDQKVLIPLNFSINVLSMVMDISGIILKGTDVSYDCRGGMVLGGGLPGLGDLELPFNFSGITRLRN